MIDQLSRIDLDPVGVAARRRPPLDPNRAEAQRTGPLTGSTYLTIIGTTRPSGEQ
jgi:hypothetical protein